MNIIKLKAVMFEKVYSPAARFICGVGGRFETVVDSLVTFSVTSFVFLVLAIFVASSAFLPLGAYFSLVKLRRDRKIGALYCTSP